MSPAAHALDRRLYELRSAQGAVASDLLELEADGTYALLAAGGGLTGTTAARAQPALSRVAELWQGLQLLDQLLDQVVALRDEGRPDERRTTELVALLNSPSIVVPSEPVPWVERALTSDPTTTRAVTAQALLDEMDEAFAPVRAVVAEVDAAWQGFLPRLERTSTEADRLAVELPGNRAVADLRGLLSALSTRVVEDPLGAADELGEVERALEAAGGLRSEVARLHGLVAEGATTVDQVEDLVDQGRRALARSRAEVADPQGLLDPVDPGAVTGERGLRPWLDRLDRLVTQGEVERASKGLSRWRELADQTLAAARQVAEANARPSGRRQELQGLLRAARVKAGAVGRAEDPGLTDLADRADRALAVPCDLAEAEARVDAYLDELRRPPPGAASAPQGSGRWAPAEPPAYDVWKEMSA